MANYVKREQDPDLLVHAIRFLKTVPGQARLNACLVCSTIQCGKSAPKRRKRSVNWPAVRENYKRRTCSPPSSNDSTTTIPLLSAAPWKG